MNPEVTVRKRDEDSTKYKKYMTKSTKSPVISRTPFFQFIIDPSMDPLSKSHCPRYDDTNFVIPDSPSSFLNYSKSLKLLT